MTVPLKSLLGNTQKLDGGAMFGHVPKALWSQWLKPDEQNRVELACRALLAQEAQRNVLLEAGIGAFFSPELRERFGVKEDKHVLLDSLAAAGLSHQDIDVVILSHLHFDHAGGLLSTWEEGKAPELLFPKARYLVSKAAWERAIHPHVRDRASFVPELNKLLAESGRLELIENETSELLGPGYRFSFSQGHTPGLMHTWLDLPDQQPLVFASDLIPATSWVHLPVTMGYDRMAEVLIDEKQVFLDRALQEQARVFYTHDPKFAFSRVARDAKGKYGIIDPRSDF